MFPLIKKSSIVSLTYEVSDAEKTAAEQAIICFDYCTKELELASNHLNIMKTPFKNNPETSPEDVVKARSAVRRFRDKAVDNFNEFEKAALKCVQMMQEFASDTQTVKLMKSFITSIDELEVKVNKFVKLFKDLNSKSFIQDVVSQIEEIQKKCDEIKEIVEERVKNHIQEDILAKSWVDSVSKNLQIELEKKTPLVMQLHQERQKQLNDVVKSKAASLKLSNTKLRNNV